MGYFEDFKALVQRGYECLSCKKDISTSPCEASELASKSQNPCPYCGVPRATLNGKKRTTHIHRCAEKKEKGLSDMHNIKFSVDMAKGYGSDVWTPTGVAQ